MSRSCACFSGPPVSRTADRGRGRATSGIAFLICCARAEPNRQNRPKTANENNGIHLLILIVLALINGTPRKNGACTYGRGGHLEILGQAVNRNFAVAQEFLQNLFPAV